MKKKYELDDAQHEMVKRITNEFSHRVKAPLHIEMYTMKYELSPTELSEQVQFELQAGRHKYIGMLSVREIKSFDGEIFYVFLRRLCNQFIDYLVQQAVKN